MHQRLNELGELLRKKADSVNLFSKRDRELLLEKHFPDALEVLKLWRSERGQKALDLGTGGGIPGLVLASVTEGLGFDLMDSVGKKLAALEEVIRAMDLEEVQTVEGRFEKLAHEAKYRGKYDLVFARAVSDLRVLLEYSAGFLKRGGLLFAWKGPKALEELAEAKHALEVLNFEFVKKHHYFLPGGEERYILEFKKMEETPHEYPRAVGVPMKRPL